MATRQKIALSAAFTALIAAAVGLLLFLELRSPGKCPLCHRGIHAESRAVIEVGGKRREVCCVHCGITAHTQERAPVRLVEVSDFRSGKPLRPDSAWYVHNTPVVLCERHAPPMDAHKQTYVRVFDRCEPSIFAFAREADARSFAAHNGGDVARLQQVIEKYGVQP